MGYKINTNKDLVEEELIKKLLENGIEITMPKDKDDKKSGTKKK